MNWLGQTLNDRRKIDERAADIREFLRQHGWLERADAEALASCCTVLAVNYTALEATQSAGEDSGGKPLSDDEQQSALLLPHYRAWGGQDDDAAQRVMVGWIAHCKKSTPA